MLRKRYFISGYYMIKNEKLDFWVVFACWPWQSATYCINKVVDDKMKRHGVVPMIQQFNKV